MEESPLFVVTLRIALIRCSVCLLLFAGVVHAGQAHAFSPPSVSAVRLEAQEQTHRGLWPSGRVFRAVLHTQMRASHLSAHRRTQTQRKGEKTHLEATSLEAALSPLLGLRVAQAPATLQPVSSSTVAPVDRSLLLLQGFSGAVVAAVSSFLIQSLLRSVLLPRDLRQATEDQLFRSSLISSFVILGGVPLLVAGTVSILGRLSNAYEGSFWWALVGAYLGQAIAFGAGTLVGAVDTTQERSLTIGLRVLFDALFTSIGAVLFYTLFRRNYQDVETLGSLTRWKNGRLHWGVPLPQVSQHAGETSVHCTVFSTSF